MFLPRPKPFTHHNAICLVVVDFGFANTCWNLVLQRAYGLSVWSGMPGGGRGGAAVPFNTPSNALSGKPIYFLLGKWSQEVTSPALDLSGDSTKLCHYHRHMSSFSWSQMSAYTSGTTTAFQKKGKMKTRERAQAFPLSVVPTGCIWSICFNTWAELTLSATRLAKRETWKSCFYPSTYVVS